MSPNPVLSRTGYGRQHKPAVYQAKHRHPPGTLPVVAIGLSFAVAWAACTGQRSVDFALYGADPCKPPLNASGRHG